MKTVAIRISTDGSVQLIYDDDSPIIGHAKELKVERASDVRFNNTTGKWVVEGCSPETRAALENLGEFDRRCDAIAAEVEALTTMLRRTG